MLDCIVVPTGNEIVICTIFVYTCIIPIGAPTRFLFWGTCMPMDFPHRGTDPVSHGFKLESPRPKRSFWIGAPIQFDDNPSCTNVMLSWLSPGTISEDYTHSEYFAIKSCVHIPSHHLFVSRCLQILETR